MADVVLHVGLAKTGTTTIQAALESRAEQLAGSGVLFPGGRHRAQRLAVYDLLGQRVAGDDREVVAGSLRRLLDEIGAHTGPTVVVSEEELSLARPRHVRRLVRALPGHRVHVVVGVRDLARTLVSAWQQSVVTGGCTPWPEFIASVRDEPGAPVSDGVSFWLRHDLLRVIDTWATAVPPHRIRVVTVPPSGADPQVLLDRFARAAGLPDDAWSPLGVRPRNVSFGVCELEVIRRINAALTDVLNLDQYRYVIEAGIRPGVADRPSRPLRLPSEHLAWARERGAVLVAELERRGVEVVGEVSDLVPPVPAAPAPPPGRATETELLAATEGVLTALALAHGALFRRYRRAFFAREGRWPSIPEVLGSTARATGFALQKALLRHSDHHRALAWAAHAYLARTSARSPLHAPETATGPTSTTRGPSVRVRRSRGS